MLHVLSAYAPELAALIMPAWDLTERWKHMGSTRFVSANLLALPVG